MSTIEDIRSHIERKFAATELSKSPFPHLIIEGILPDDVFQEMLAKNPFKNNAGTEWISKARSDKMLTDTPYHARKQINFHKNDPFDASKEDAAFWSMIQDCFLHDFWFDQLVLDKYRDYFIIRFGDFIDDPDFFPAFKKEMFLMRHEPGYSIGPHTDIPTRVFTGIFALAEREGFEEFGTQLLAHKNPRVRCWGNNHYPEDDFIIKGLAPYKPNNFLLFFKTRSSFHSVRAIDDTVPNQRYGLMYQFYEPFEGVFEDLSMPDLMTPKHEKHGTVGTILRAIKNSVKS